MATILLLIPILCVSLSIFLVDLINFVLFNELDILLLISSLFINLITTFITLKIIIKNIKGKIFTTINNNFYKVLTYYLLCLTSIVGIFFLINSIKNGANIIYLIIGCLFILMLIIATFNLLIKRKKNN